MSKSRKPQQKLELTWIGKDEEPRLEPRILIENPEYSYGDEATENMLIQGDNLLALKALEQEYAGKVKCICIDPPYNTGSAFEHYDDGVEHSIWLSLMQNRLKIMRRLLSREGTIWVFTDDTEAHYLKVMLDEIFGRSNFLTTLCWHKRVSPANDAKFFSSDFDFILVYAKDTSDVKINRVPRDESQLKYYKNPDNDPRGVWNSSAYTCAKSAEERPNLYYAIVNPNTGKEIWPKKTRVWAYEKATHLNNVENDLLYWGKDGKARMPRIKKFIEDRKDVIPRSIWTHSYAGHNQEARLETLKLFPDTPFSTPKPERLIERVLTIATNPGDLVLDSFLGSGTTAAVAHKMGRRWIGVELGEHAKTHCVPRLQKVVDGEQGASAKP